MIKKPILPILSCILPNYNHAKYLKESMPAILDKKFSNLELIIIDDGSQDNSINIIENFQKKYKNIILIKNKENKGPLFCINKGIDIANGKYLMFCSADDIVISDFEEVILFLEKNQNIQVCTTNPSYFLDKNPYIFKEQRILKNKKILTPLDTLSLLSKTKFCISPHSSIFRKNVVLKYKKFDENFQWFADWYLAHKIALLEDIGHVPISLGAFRIRNQSYGSRRKFSEKKRVYKKLIKQILSEKKSFQEIFKKSGLFTHLGYFIFFFILKHPSFFILFSKKERCKYFSKDKGFFIYSK